MKIINKILLIILIISVSAISFGQELPKKPNPPRLVNDMVSLLSKNEVSNLEYKLRNFNDSTSTQIVILIINSLDGYSIADYSQRIAEKWGIGQKSKDNGILILVKPKTLRERGQVFIATGYGLEGVIPDAIAKRIVEKEILPNFKLGKFYHGLDRATNVIMALTKGEFKAENYKKKGGGSGKYVLIIFILLWFILRRKRRGGSDNHFGGGGFIPTVTFGSFNNTSGGGFSSGGFGGFGGGSFGGGGAGGSW